MKNLIQQIVKNMPNEIEILSMKVTSADYSDVKNPLVELVDLVDEKNTAGPENVIIPEKLSIYTKEFDMEAILNGSSALKFSFNGGTLGGTTALELPAMTHNHLYQNILAPLSLTDGNADLNEFDFTIQKTDKGIITIYNDLKVDDIVTVIAFNQANSYYILDREVY